MRDIGTMEDIQNQETEVSAAPAPENSISPEPPTKHPLEHKWTLWFYENNKRNEWSQNLHEVYTFDTVEDFWCLYNHIRPVSELGQGNDYSLFKNGISPMWEDKKNHKGGRWLINVESRQKAQLNDIWLNVILYMIGESFDDSSDEICGAYINIRAKCDKISLWTGDATKIESIETIGKKLKHECLHLPQDVSIYYESHADSAYKSKSTKSSKYISVV